MNKKNILLTLLLLLVLSSGCTLSERKDKYIIDKEDLHNLSFMTVTDENNIVYTTDKESYILEGDKKLHLGYEIASKFQNLGETLYIAEKDSKQGVLDKDFEPIVAFNYDSITSLGNNLIIGENQGKKYLVNIQDYHMKGPFENISSLNSGNIIKLDKNNKSKFLNNSGKEILELRDKNVLFFRDGVFVIEKNGLFGLYDTTNNRYVPEVNQEIYFSHDNILVKKSGKYFLNGNIVDIKRFYPTMSDVVIYDFKDGFGLLNLKDGVFYKEVYDEIAPNFDDYLIVGKKGKYNVMNKYMERSIEYVYDYIIKVGKNSFAGGTDSTGLFALIVGDKKVTDEKFENLIEINENYFIGVIGNMYTLINKNGKEIVTCDKNELLYYNESVAIIKHNDIEYVYPLVEEM